MIIPMVFRHFCGEDICRTADEVKAVFSKHVNGVNQFFISDISDKLYPYLSILVNGEKAYIWYSPFAGTENPGFQAYGEDTESDPDDITVFYVNTPTEEMEIRNEYVCTKEKALQVVLKFMYYDEWPVCYEDLPNCVEWEEL